MSGFDFPPEILNHIIDFLYDDGPWTLKSCCLVSKLWIPRSRKHLFAHIMFTRRGNYFRWKESFPDPASSPAQFTRTLKVYRVPDVTGESRLIWSSFCHVERLVLYRSSKFPEEGTEFSLSQFQKFLPSLKYLSIRSGA